MMPPAEGRDSTVGTSCWKLVWEEGVGGTTLALLRSAALAGAASASETTSVALASVPFNMTSLLCSWENCWPGGPYATGRATGRGPSRALRRHAGELAPTMRECL